MGAAILKSLLVMGTVQVADLGREEIIRATRKIRRRRPNVVSEAVGPIHIKIALPPL